MQPDQPNRSEEPPVHPRLQTALLLIAVMALLIGLAALSTFR